MERIWREAGMAYFKILFQHLPERNEDSHDITAIRIACVPVTSGYKLETLPHEPTYFIPVLLCEVK
jgi:hypothetical protein